MLNRDSTRANVSSSGQSGLDTLTALARDAALLVGSFALIFAVRGFIQDRGPTADDYQLVGFFAPVYLGFRWLKLRHDRRAN